MASALLALLGVVVRIGITKGSDFLFERRRERADQRAARRLVTEEVHSI
jgi:hypothetical protein